MLDPATNDRMCRVGLQTPMGTVLRRYWLPVLLSSEVAVAAEPLGPGIDWSAVVGTHGVIDEGGWLALLPQGRSVQA